MNNEKNLIMLLWTKITSSQKQNMPKIWNNIGESTENMQNN